MEDEDARRKRLSVWWFRVMMGCLPRLARGPRTTKSIAISATVAAPH